LPPNTPSILNPENQPAPTDLPAQTPGGITFNNTGTGTGPTVGGPGQGGVSGDVLLPGGFASILGADTGMLGTGPGYLGLTMPNGQPIPRPDILNDSSQPAQTPQQQQFQGEIQTIVNDLTGTGGAGTGNFQNIINDLTGGGAGTGGNTPGNTPDQNTVAQNMQVNTVYQQLVNNWVNSLEEQGVSNPASLPQWPEILAELQAQAQELVLGSKAPSTAAGLWPINSGQVPAGVTLPAQ
jgi:hypothetical protein